MSELSKENGVRENAYVLIWEDDGQTKMSMPMKGNLEDDDHHIVSFGQGNKTQYLYDYKDVMKYIKKNLANVESNIMIARVVDLISVDIKSVDNKNANG